MPTICLVNQPEFSDWGSIRGGVSQLPALKLYQGWRDRPEALFAAGSVRLAHNSKFLLVYAELQDADIFSLASSDGQRLWELGDVFEIFLKDPLRDDYCEFHISPNRFRLQLRYPSESVFHEFSSSGSKDLTPFFIAGQAFEFRLKIQTGSWEVFAEIPWKAIRPDQPDRPPEQILVSFSRYDHTRGTSSPVLSSTSAHAQLSFHRQHEWKQFSIQ